MLDLSPAKLKVQVRFQARVVSGLLMIAYSSKQFSQIWTFIYILYYENMYQSEAEHLLLNSR